MPGTVSRNDGVSGGETPALGDSSINKIAETKRLKFALYEVYVVDVTDFGLSIFSYLEGNGSLQATLCLSELAWCCRYDVVIVGCATFTKSDSGRPIREVIQYSQVTGLSLTSYP